MLEKNMCSVYESIVFCLTCLCTYQTHPPKYFDSSVCFPDKGRIKQFWSDFLKCFIDISIHINFVATPCNKIIQRQGKIYTREKKVFGKQFYFLVFYKASGLVKNITKLYFYTKHVNAYFSVFFINKYIFSVQIC